MDFGFILLATVAALVILLPILFFIYGLTGKTDNRPHTQAWYDFQRWRITLRNRLQQKNK